MKIRKLIAIILVTALPLLFGLGASCNSKTTLDLSREREAQCHALVKQLLEGTLYLVCRGNNERPADDIWKSTGPYMAGCQVETASGIVFCDPEWLVGSEALKNRTPVNRIQTKISASWYLCHHPDTGRLVQKVTVIAVVSSQVKDGEISLSDVKNDPIDGKVEEIPAGTPTPCDIQ